MTSFWDASIYKNEQTERIKMDSEELNIVLGGGLVPGSFVLLSGEPGVGKSTLTLQMANWFAQGRKAAYVSCEENIYQVFARANRLNIKNENIEFLQEDKLENILATLEDSDVDMAIIDSISLIYSDNSTGVKWGVSQVKHIAGEFMNFSKRTGKSIILIGHITKDGDISGPKTLEHLVDVVLFMEGDAYETFRILRTNKNRFGATDEIGIFDMTEQGFVDLPNPSKDFVSSKNTYGNAIGVALEGTRALLVEIESLTVASSYGYPKRSSRGVLPAKLDQMIAVATKYLWLGLDKFDCYTNIGRGLKIQDPANDLSIIASLYSSFNSKTLNKAIFIGEVSLTGVVKNVPRIKKRIEEAKKLGYAPIYIPKGSYKGDMEGIVELEYVSDLKKHFAAK